MSIFNVFTLLGGLALFLYGMNVMGNALEKQAGNRLNSILEKLTASPLKGFLLGLIVTAIIQSSSATTVMVVGFVNSGIMRLNQAIGIIMGSNVGTTVTSWILSLTGLEGSSMIVQLFKPSTFAPLLAFAGIVLQMAFKDEKKRNVGNILLGFTVLMTGMDLMSGAVKPLANVPAFTNLFIKFSNPILGLLVGALLTGIIQSSSASVGILQALSATGAIPYSSAIPIILGQNIGTCVTALISSVGTNRNARRAAVVHLYFNIIGSVLFLCIYLLISSLFNIPILSQPTNGFGIAVVHTLFNVVCTAVLLPFNKLLEKLAYLTIPDRQGSQDEAVQLLDSRLLNTPSLAVERSRQLANIMAQTAHTALQDAIALTHSFDAAKAEAIREAENETDHYEDILGTYLVHLSSRDLNPDDNHEVSLLLHLIGDFERIGDHALNIVEAAEEIKQKSLVFSEGAQKELAVLEQAVTEVIHLAMTAFLTGDLSLARRVEPLEQVVDELTREIRSRHVRRLKNGECTIELGFVLSDLLGNFERVADHSSNIAVEMIEMQENALDTHEYLKQIKADENSDYEVIHAGYATKYSLN